MKFKIIPFLGLTFLTMALKAQDFNYSLNNHLFIADSRSGIQLIHSDSTGYYISVFGDKGTDQSAVTLYKLDKNLNVFDSITVPKPKICTIQIFFKTNDGIGWFHDFYDTDSSARFYEVTQLTFRKTELISFTIGNIENWQSHLAWGVVGCNFGFSTDKKMVYFYLWKEKSKSDKTWVSEVTILDMNLNLIKKSSLPEDINAVYLRNGNAILEKDTTFLSIKQILETDCNVSTLKIKPVKVNGFNLQSWHVPSDKITNFEVKGINQGINHGTFVYDNNQKLHFTGFYTYEKNFCGKGFFDYEITDKKELCLLNEHFFTNDDLDKLRVKGYDPTTKSSKVYGLKKQYKIRKVIYNPAGFYDYLIESQYFIENNSVVMPAGGGFIAGALAGAATAYLNEYSSSNPTWYYEPLIIIRKPTINLLYSFLMLPTAQRSKNSNSTGVYTFEYNGSQYFISNESKKNSRESIKEWDYFSRFTDKGQTCISSFDHNNTLVRKEVFPVIHKNPAIVNVKQIIKLNEREFFIVVKPSGSASEHYLGKLTFHE